MKFVRRPIRATVRNVVVSRREEGFESKILNYRPTADNL